MHHGRTFILVVKYFAIDLKHLFTAQKLIYSDTEY